MDLEYRFNQAYEDPVPAIKEVTKQTFENDLYKGFKIKYSRPWDEPWW